MGMAPWHHVAFVIITVRVIVAMVTAVIMGMIVMSVSKRHAVLVAATR
jgi:hypothetical protein